ncbi:MAG: divalent-cation tolerance protein CutA [Pirellulaceae bacterium]
MSRFIQISTTCDQRQPLQKLATELVTRKLAACVQIGGPVFSTYRWQDSVETSEEWVCTIKTLEDRQDAVADFIKSAHPYDEPEIIVTPISGGSDSYLQWLKNQVQ